MKNKLLEDVGEVLIELDSHKSLVSIVEEISINDENFDRHFTTKSRFELLLVSSRIRVSGGIMMLNGADCYYELNTGNIYKINREGKKPSFFKDIQFLMVGPAWLLHFLYKKAGIKY
jgi:hypothetical protein